MKQDGSVDAPLIGSIRALLGYFALVSLIFSLSLSLLTVPGPALETFVGDDVNTILILNLLSGTEYSVKVFASYSTGFSDALEGVAKTCRNA